MNSTSPQGLRSVGCLLPREIRDDHAERIQSFLKHVDRQQESEWSLTLYGSAAVALYVADTGLEYEPNFTRDIDIARMDPEEVDRSAINNHSVDPPLVFQPYDVERWLVHPDWRDATVNFTALIGTTFLNVELLHPIDLIITKLERAMPKDLEDGQLLFERYPEEVDRVRERVREAAKYYVLSDRVVGQIEYSFAGIFQDSIELQGLL